MADQAVRLDDAAHPEMAHAVRGETGAEVAVHGVGVSRLRLGEIPGKVGPALRRPAVLEGTATGMAPAAGWGFDLFRGVEFAAADPVVGGKVDLPGIGVLLGGGAARRRIGKPLSVHSRRQDPGAFGVVLIAHDIETLLEVVTLRDRGVAVANAAGFLRAVGIEAVLLRGDPVPLLVFQPDVLMVQRFGPGHGDQKCPRNQVPRDQTARQGAYPSHDRSLTRPHPGSPVKNGKFPFQKKTGFPSRRLRMGSPSVSKARPVRRAPLSNPARNRHNSSRLCIPEPRGG